MLFNDLLKESFRSLLSNKTRSGLTILGIVIGIASVISMVSIGQGTQKTITSTIENLGSNLLTIMPGAVMQGGVSLGRGTFQSMKNEDAEGLKDISGIEYISPEVSRRYQIVSSTGLNTNASVIGVSADYYSARNMTMTDGLYFNDTQLKNLSRVTILGYNASQDLFGEADPLNKTIKINKINFKVIGVFAEKGSMGFSSIDDMVFIPLLTMQKILTGNDYLSNIVVSVKDKNMIDDVKNEITLALAKKHNIDPENPDFTIISQADILSSLNQITTTFTIFLAAIAGISLLVGGIGIMNMMLTNVTERTREIGIRKAIGATRKDIVLQFLSEAIILTTIGGIIGIILGWLISILIGKIMSITTLVTFSAIALSFGVSAGIGIIFGYYPAKKAANLNPIDALRYE
jgi:putative ABC transport system permease protein